MADRKQHLAASSSTAAGGNASSRKRGAAGQSNRFPVTEEDVFVNIVDEDQEDDIQHHQASVPTSIVSTRSRRSNYRASIVEEGMDVVENVSPPGVRKLAAKHNLQGPSGMEHHHQMLLHNEFDATMIDPVDGIGIEMEGYGEDEEFYVDEEEESFIPGNNMAEFDLLEDSFHVYDQLPSNLIICDLCESRPVFANRDQFNTHRYQRHGSIVSVCACPDFDCDQVFASIGTIKRHLAVDHNLPLETHYKKFDNITEFSEWVVFVQYATGTRFVMHNRQQPKRRQLLFCVFSDHRKSNKRTGMVKPKGCCPAHVNYTINPDGTVEVIYQMYHHGHDPKSVDVETIKPWSLAKANRESRCKVTFPSKPLIIGCRPMQYVQIDIIEMPETEYRHRSKYSNALIVTDMFSKFMFGRSLIDGDENDQERVVCRLLVEIFNSFGLPEGYSSVFGKEAIDRCMCQVSESFRTDIQCITSSTPCYAALRRNIELKAESDLKDKLRWPESLPATILTHNQTPHAVFQFRISPFETMFGRRAWYKTNPDSELPWLLADRYDHAIPGGSIGEQPPVHSTRQHDPSLSIYDSTGKPLQDPLKSRILKTISLVEARCDRWEEQALNSVTSSGTLSSAEMYKKLGIRQAFMPGDYVYVRGLNIPCEKGGFLRGLVSEVCWEPSTQFPYRVHVETANGAKRELIGHNEEQFGVEGVWPTEESPSFWVSAYDVCSSSLELGIKRQPQYGSKFNSFYCNCSENCSLFGSENCSNGMSKACCDASGKKCGYHEFYDPKNMPVDKFVESYGQNPEKMVKKVANRRANARRMGGESNDELSAAEDAEASAQHQNGSSQLSGAEYLRSNSSSPLPGRNRAGNEQDAGGSPSSSKKMKDVNQTSDELDKEQERYHELEKELAESEHKLGLLKPKDSQRPSEEYLLLESDTSLLREEWNRLKKFLEVRDQQRKFKRILEANPNSASSNSAVRRRGGLRSQYMGDPTELTRQTRLIMEDNQIFPIVSMIHPQAGGEGGSGHEAEARQDDGTAYYSSPGHLQQQQQQQRAYAEHAGEQSSSAERMDQKGKVVSSEEKQGQRPLQRGQTRGILSRRGPAKGVAKSIRNSIETPFTYVTTTANIAQSKVVASTTQLNTTSVQSLSPSQKTRAGRQHSTALSPPQTHTETSPRSPLKASPSTKPRTQPSYGFGKSNTTATRSEMEQEEMSLKKRPLETETEPARRSSRVSKKPKITKEE